MTALLTLEAVGRREAVSDQPITASAVVNDQDPEGSSAGIEEGEVLTVEQLLYCLLLGVRQRGGGHSGGDGIRFP